jgi:ribonuclease VapC
LIADTSAIVSVIRGEDGHGQILEALATAPEVSVGAPTLFEASMVLTDGRGVPGKAIVAKFLADNQIGTIPFGERHWVVAAEAFLRYGKGRHPAKLNYGDCMTYATARLAERPLLCIGDDFAKTDLRLAG